MENSEAAHREKEVCDVLDRLNIKYEIHRHEPLFTAADVFAKKCNYEGLNVKNLLVKDKKSGQLYLAVVPDQRRLDFRKFAAWTGWSKRMTFADDEELQRCLGVQPGSCSIFGIINDKQKELALVLCREIAEAGGDEKINFHPNVNTATVSLTIEGMWKFIRDSGIRCICESLLPEEEK